MGGFARTGSTHDGDKLSFADGEGNAAQGVHGFFTHPEVSFDILKFDNLFHLSFLHIGFDVQVYLLFFFLLPGGPGMKGLLSPFSPTPSI